MTAYLNELRVGAAAQLLINTDESILDIGFRVGFGNYSNFNRQFKRIKGFGPRTLRQQFSPGSSPEDRISTHRKQRSPRSLRKRRRPLSVQVIQDSRNPRLAEAQIS